MILVVDTTSALPPYEQIRDQVATMAATGVLAVGTRMPAIRQLAADLSLANGTVARAYRELERDGVIEPRGRHGTFTRRADHPTVRGAAEHGRLDDCARAFAVAVHQLGVDHSRALDAARRALGALAGGPG